MKALVLLGPAGSGKSWITAQLLAACPRGIEIDPAGGAKQTTAAMLEAVGVRWQWDLDRQWRTVPLPELQGRTPRALLDAIAAGAPETGLAWLGYSLGRAKFEQKTLAIVGARRASEVWAVREFCPAGVVVWRLDFTHAASDATFAAWWTLRELAAVERSVGTILGVSGRHIPQSRVIRAAAVLDMARQDGLL